jgi:hypothetical protein
VDLQAMKGILILFILAVLVLFVAAAFNQTSAEAIDWSEWSLIKLDLLRNFAFMINAIAMAARWMVQLWYSA